MIKIFLILAVIVQNVFAQNDPKKIVDTEHAFAAMAAEKGTKTAFLEFMTDDAVVFIPLKVDARANWISRKDSTALLTWDPNYADISSDGAVGYTTGNWEFRPKGKTDAPAAFGDFVTVWKLQPNGTYKWVIDMGISHDKPSTYSTDWTMSKHTRGVKAADSVERYIDKLESTARRKGLAAAYKEFAAEDIRSYLEGKLPYLGRSAAWATSKAQSGSISIDTTVKPVQASDIAYLLTEYSRVLNNGKVEKGNILQIWKFYSGKWHLVLDVINPLPAK